MPNTVSRRLQTLGLRFLSISKPKIGNGPGSVPHQKFENMFIEEVYKKLEGKIKFKKNEVSLVELKYSLFMCELMVDENIIMAFLEKRKPGHYVVENGFIFINEDPLRGNKDSMSYLDMKAQINANRQQSIDVQTMLPGSKRIADAMESDERYQIPSAPQFAITNKKDEEIW